MLVLYIYRTQTWSSPCQQKNCLIFHDLALNSARSWNIKQVFFQIFMILCHHYGVDDIIKMADKISRSFCMLRSSHSQLYSMVMYMPEVCSLWDPPEQDSHSHLLVSHLTQSHTWHLIMQVSRNCYGFQIYFYFHTAVDCNFSLKNKQTKNPNKQKNYFIWCLWEMLQNNKSKDVWIGATQCSYQGNIHCSLLIGLICLISPKTILFLNNPISALYTYYCEHDILILILTH